jgi:hypothetical protein
VAATVWLALRRSADTTPNSSETLRQIILKATITKGSKLDHPLTAIVDVVRAGNQRSDVAQLGVDDATDAAIAPPKLCSDHKEVQSNLFGAALLVPASLVRMSV